MKKWFSVLSFFFLFSMILFSCDSGTETRGPNTSTKSDSSGALEWKLGAQMWTFHTYPFVTAIEKVDSAGIRFIEAFQGQPLGGDFNDTFGLTMRDDSKTKLKTLLAQKGIQLVAMGVISPATVQEWKKNFQFAKEMGLEYITAEPKKEHLDTINAMAGEYKILVAIHDHPNPSPYAHPDSVLQAINGRINIGACADIGHWARNGLDVVDCLKKLEGRIYGVHLKDIQKFNDVHAADTTLGNGVIKMPEVFREFKRQNFKGMFSIEHELHWENNVPDVIYNRDYFNRQVSALKL
jgi:sugar phosphate isomerase/epimerase